MSKRTKVTFSLILVICLLLSGLPSAVPVAATEADEPLTSPITESTATETQEVAEQAIAVIREEEGLRGKYEKHFLMSDGSYQAVAYSHPVHELVDGVWVEIESISQNARSNVSPDSAQQNIIDNYVWEGHGVQDNNSVRLYIGNKSGYEARAYIQFSQMPTIPAGCIIGNATMTVNIVSGTSTANNASAYMVTEEEWTSSTISWDNMPEANILLEEDISHNERTKYQFSCLTAVQHWYDGDTSGQNENYGVMLCYCDQDIEDYNSFYSADCTDATMRPTLTITYQPQIIDVDEGDTYALTAPDVTGTITWTSSNTNIATVTSEGIVEGVHAGQVTITAQAEGYTDCTFSLWVTLPDGIYYFNNADSNLSMYNNKSSNLYTESQVTTDPYRVYRLWKTQYVSNGMYLLQPLHDTSVYLTTDSSGSVYVAEMSESVAYSNAKWKIAWNAFGYAINYLGSSSRSLQPAATGGTAAPLVIAGTWQSNFKSNWTPVSADGVFLRDTTTLETITSSTAFNIELGQSSTPDDFGLAPEYYGDVQGVSWSSSYGAAGVNSHTGKVISIRCGKATISINAIINGVQYSAAYAIQITGSVTFYGIANARHDHASSLTSAKIQLESNSWDEVTLQTGSVAANTCKNDLLATNIFTSRSHGIVAHSEHENVPSATGIVLNDNTTNVIAFYSHNSSNMTSESVFISSGEDYSNIDVALFIACETGYGGKGANNLPTMIVNCGAKAAIGFTDPIACASANTWTSRFYTAFLWGYSLGDAVDYASEPFDEYSGLSREQVIICGDASLILS